MSRIVILSLAAAAFAGLTQIYVRSVPSPLPGPNLQEERLHRPFAPQVLLFPEPIADGMVVAIYALAGRLLFRLRLSPNPRREGQSISLNLRRLSSDLRKISR
jgi:hypothetical protein